MIEREPIHNQTAEKLRQLDIKAVLFDLDDTLIHTGELFSKYMTEYVETISTLLRIDPQTLRIRLQELNDEGYHKMGVSPQRWSLVLDQLSQELNDDGVVKENLNILMKIYTDEPRIKSGAKVMLKGLKDSGFKLGLVTHANTDWTMRKLNQTGLLNFFDTIKIADENGFKTVEHWKSGIEMLGVEGHQCLVVGDNLKGDIIPSFSLGAKVLWMPSSWSVYRQGEVPEGTIVMDELIDFWGAVQKLQ